MIIPVLTLEDINQVINNAGDIIDLDRNELKRMVLGSMFNDEKFIMADVDEGKMKAFLFATIEVLNGEDVCYIQSCSSKKQGSVQEMLDKLIVWAKQRGLKRLVFMTQRNPLAWQRKYKFNQTSFVMQREI